MTAQHKFGFLITALIMAVSMVACGNASPASGTGKPEDGAKAMFDAVFAGKDIAPMVCSSSQGDVSKMKEAFSRFGDAGATIDTSGLTYTASDVSGDKATVKVGGKLKVTVSGTSKDVPLPGLPISMKNENGWKVCE